MVSHTKILLALEIPVCNHCLSKVGGGLSLKAQISRPSFLTHSSLFPFWPPTLFPKFLAWESRYQVPLPAVSFFLCLSFLTCILKMRSSLQTLPALPLAPPSYSYFSLCFLFPHSSCLSPLQPSPFFFPISSYSPLSVSHFSLPICPPSSSERGEGSSGMGAPEVAKGYCQSTGSSPSLNNPCLGWALMRRGTNLLEPRF